MSAFKAGRVTRTATLRLPASADQVFPLFGPVREAEWAEGWKPDMLYSESPEGNEPGAVFLTRHGGEPETIWLVAAFDPAARHIEYVRVTPGSRIGRVVITCRDETDGVTLAEVTYQFTAISEVGNKFIAAFGEAHYQEMMSEWEAAIRHLLTTGSRLPHPH